MFLHNRVPADTPFSSFLVDTHKLLTVISYLLLHNNPTQK